MRLKKIIMNDKHVCICPWMPSYVHLHMHAQIKETVSSHKWDFPRPDLNDPSLSVEHEESRGRSGGIQSRAEARGSLKATNLSNVLHAAIQTQHHSGVRNKQNEKSNWNFRIIHTYAPVPLTPIWCSDKLLFEIQWNAPQEKNERKMGEWEVGKTRMRQESLWNTHVSLAFGNSFMMLCVYISVACGSIWRHGPLSAFGFF